MAAGAPAAAGDATVHTARRWPTAALVALTVILTFESFRVLFPHLYGLKEREGLMMVLIAFLAVAVAPPPEYPPRVPGEFEEIARLLAAGFTTAQNLEACEFPTSNDNCSDYILVGPGLSQPSFQVGPNFGDHRMLVAEVTGQ